jgi:SAM-dependent methyltransferase
MPGYYTEKLAAERLRACYDLAPPRTKAYLEAEIKFVVAKTMPSMLALELGCGYGRVLERLLPRVRVACGIDTSPFSLRLDASGEKQSHYDQHNLQRPFSPHSSLLYVDTITTR